MYDHVKDRFLRLIQYNTQSDPHSGQHPSTTGQEAFAELLAGECRRMGLANVRLSRQAYVYAELPGNLPDGRAVPVIGFIAHMDTSPDCSGEGVRGQLIRQYDGGDIRLNDKVTLSPSEFPSLLDYTGQELIVTHGDTLLGADDKAGVAEILTAMEYLVAHPEIKHGPIRIAFTPDEEIGQGADHFDVPAFGADFAFTMDGGPLGELEYESFNAAGVKVMITGKSVHPGSAKGIMINAAQIAVDFASRFPIDETPSTTEGREGFFHLCGISGGVEQARLDFLIRDFDRGNFEARKVSVQKLAEEFQQRYGREAIQCTIRDQYRNMAEVLINKPQILKLAGDAMEAVGVTPMTNPIRGGTDGARLSFMGLPCPNIFTGGHNYHGPYEYIPVSSMEKACQVIVKIAELAAKVSF